MEEGLLSSAKFDESIDTDDSKYLCGLSTILVANIQELKDRISQIEFIFCSQLFPKFQSRSKSLEKRLFEARTAVDDEWKKREKSLLDQIKDLRLEKQCAQEEVQWLNKSLKETKTKLINTEHEKIQLLAKVENLERNREIIAGLKEQLVQKFEELAEGKKLQEKLLQQIDIKDDNLSAEQSKRKGLFEEFSKLKDNYKNLKSQYNFLLRKIGDSKEHKPQADRMEEEKGSPSPVLSKRSPPDSEHKDEEMIKLTSRPTKIKVEKESLQKPSSNKSYISPASTSASCNPIHISSNTKPEPSIGQKRSASSWRVTRARQEPGGADPHDDFLNTPMEIARNLNMGHQEEVQDLPVLAPNDMDFNNNSDDETQEVINAVPLKQEISVLGPAGNKGFKYVEPVRKKTDREKLKGVECKQCKKFYDAVLPDGDEATNGQRSMRCEHQDGVSRHRYKYAPPMTPEGFWNIGFESEM